MKYFDDYIAQTIVELKLRKTQLIVYTVIIVITAILGIYIGIKNMQLEQENEALTGVVQMQSSMIADLEENCRELSKEMER